MQTVIKDDFDAGQAGDLAVLPSFRSAASVVSHRAGMDIAPGDPVALASGGADSTVLPVVDATSVGTAIGIAVRAHSNMLTFPQFGSNTTEGIVNIDSPVGIVQHGPIRVSVVSGATIKAGDLAAPSARNTTTGLMDWNTAPASTPSRFRFATPVQRGGTAIVMVTDGDVMAAGYPNT